MPKNYDPRGRYDVLTLEGEKLGELVKGVLYEGPPDFLQEVAWVDAGLVDEALSIAFKGFELQLVERSRSASEVLEMPRSERS